MLAHRWPAHHRARALGISLLILSLAHTPWPQADFHNVRHHDEPGQVCEHHHHLLTWHPQAGQAEDVSILHWHWVPPLTDGPDSGHSGDRPAIHANADNWSATAPDSTPAIVPDASSSRLVVPPTPCLLGLETAYPTQAGDGLRPRPGAGMAPVRTFGATYAPTVRLAAWLQHWSC